MRRGRLAVAEGVVTVQDARAPEDVEVRQHIIALLWVRGGLDEACSLLEWDWQSLGRRGQLGSEAALELLRMHINLSVYPMALVGVEGIS